MKVLDIARLKINVEISVRIIAIAGVICETWEAAARSCGDAEVIFEETVNINCKGSRYGSTTYKTAVYSPDNIGFGLPICYRLRKSPRQLQLVSNPVKSVAR